jgi:hypothetical protein
VIERRIEAHHVIPDYQAREFTYRQDLRWAAQRTPFEFRYIGEWGHGRKQKMVEYTRLPD